MDIVSLAFFSRLPPFFVRPVSRGADQTKVREIVPSTFNQL